MRIFASALSALLLATPPAAMAQDLTPAQITAMDADRNGGVEAQEFADAVAETFSRLDVNADGTLEWSEVKTVIGIGIFKEADSSHNNGISWEEYQTLTIENFSAADTDHDGVLK